MTQRIFALIKIALLLCLLFGFIQTKAQQTEWSATGTLSTARTRHTATLLTSGKVLIVGGLSVPTPCCRLASNAELYDPETGRWSATGSPSIPRYDHIAVRLLNGKVLVVGGGGSPPSLTTSAEIYDTDTGTWSDAGTLTATFLFPRAALLGDGRVLVIGALDDTAEIYDPVAKTWASAGKMNVRRSLPSMTLLSTGKVLVVGGNRGNDLRAVELYDPVANVWMLTGELTTPRVNHQATLLPDGKVLISGGGGTSENPIASAELYDPNTGKWSATGSLSTPRVLHTLTLLPNGKVLAAGGVASVSFPFPTLSSAELYDPASGVWTLTGGMNLARLNYTATLLLNGKVLVAGGATLLGETRSSTELFDSRTPAVASLSAASYLAGQFAPESIVAAFGANLAANTQIAAGLPLPTQLAGVSVRVRDRMGIERAAPLFFVSPNQINYQIPPGTANGTTTITVSNGAAGIVEITSVSPGLFSADASGAGLAAAVILRIKASGEQVYEPVGQFDPASNKMIPTPIDVGNPAEQVYLILFGTGFRHRSDLANVTAKLEGADLPVLFAGAQGDLVGVDQCNVRLPSSLAGRGDVGIGLMVDGKASNTVRVRVK